MNKTQATWVLQCIGLVFTILIAHSACRQNQSQALIQLQEAREVRSYTVTGMQVLEFKLQERYPAESTIRKISEELAAKKWQPLEQIFLYPKYQSSHSTGWSIFEDPPRDPSRVIYEWSGDWKSPEGDIVTYTFRYEDPIQKYKQTTFLLRPGNSDLKVTAIYMTKDVARAKQNQMNPAERSRW